MTSIDKSLEYEKLSNNEIVSSLWSASAVEKCRLGLADTILIENGIPSRYYITGSSGEVKLQRNLHVPTVSARWLKISEQLSTQYVAVVRQEGLTKFLTKDAFESFISESRHEGNILSVHAFLGSGHSSLIYRSHYTMNIGSGRWKISTQTYSVPQQEPVLVLNEEKIKLHDSRAASINKVTDLATTTVVRYVEKMLKVHFAEFVVDYVIDKKSQIWMLWCSKALFHRATRPDQFDSSVDLLKTSSPSSRIGSPARIGSASFREEANSLSHQFHEMAEPYKKDPRGAQIAAVAATHSFSTVDEGSPIAKSKFPNPNNCRGDYCNLEIANTGQLVLDEKQASLHAQQLFSENEISQLRKDPKFFKMMEFGSENSRATQEISMRSINLARKEKRGYQQTANESSWMSYPTPSKSIVNFTGSLLEQDSAVLNSKKSRSSVWVSTHFLSFNKTYFFRIGRGTRKRFSC
jgi:hypothetical protein